jgi:hypothetical protein
MPVVPRVGEFVKFKNDKPGEYFAFPVKQVTYRETGEILPGRRVGLRSGGSSKQALPFVSE